MPSPVIYLIPHGREHDGSARSPMSRSGLSLLLCREQYSMDQRDDLQRELNSTTKFFSPFPRQTPPCCNTPRPPSLPFGAVEGRWPCVDDSVYLVGSTEHAVPLLEGAAPSIHQPRTKLHVYSLWHSGAGISNPMLRESW